jgi:hypothetical protein
MARAVPLWGTPADGHAADQPLPPTRLAAIAQLLAHDGGHPGADRSSADAALVTAGHRAALGATLVLTRLPATSSACARVLGEAVARTRGEEVGVLAPTPPTQPRPGAFDTVAEDVVT